MEETFGRGSERRFSTGMDSPVSVAWMMNRSFAAIRPHVAGNHVAADNFTTSPGTSC